MISTEPSATKTTKRKKPKKKSAEDPFRLPKIEMPEINVPYF